jgi:CRISPR/Cas system Type II protein with McrA/HNH and RuvC-like nuclease domain
VISTKRGMTENENLTSEQKIGLPLSQVNHNLKKDFVPKLDNKIPESRQENCVYCDKKIFYYEEGIRKDVTLTIDHIIPSSKKGNGSHYNKVFCCSKCNSLKGDYSLESFIKAIATDKKLSPTKKEFMILKVTELIKYRDNHIHLMIK